MSCRKRSRGQGIVEYCFVIAFVSVLIALAFNLTKTGLFAGISNSYSSANGALTNLNQTASNSNGNNNSNSAPPL